METELDDKTNDRIADLIFEAAISKAIEDNRELLRPSIQHFLAGGNVNGQFDIYLKKLLRWTESKVIESAEELLAKERERAQAEIERLKGLIQIAFKKVQIWKQDSPNLEQAWQQFKTENNL